MKTKKFKIFGAFEKIEPQEDGTLKVSGIASSETVDGAGEVVLADAMKAAIPDYMAFGAVREMHQAWAAGTALKCEVNEAGQTEFEALIVDSEAIKKVETGTYKGFSIGGKVTGRDSLNKTVITGIRLNEISLVDRPCNPEALLTISKLDDEGPEGLATLGELRKGMWTVQDFAGLLRQIGWMAQDTAWEAENEGDNSPIPAALRDWLAEGAQIFQDMAAEEIAELLATLPAAPDAEVFAMASKLAKGEGFEDLAKAKFNSATKATLNTLHKVAMDAVGNLATCWADDKEDEEEADKGAQTGDLQKMAGLEADLAKATSDLNAATTTIATLTKRVTDLEAQPAPPKGVINANSVVSKNGDTSNPDSSEDAALQKQAEEIAKLPPEEQARLLIKMTHAARFSPVSPV
jgi:hypothetical protein